MKFMTELTTASRGAFLALILAGVFTLTACSSAEKKEEPADKNETNKTDEKKTTGGDSTDVKTRSADTTTTTKKEEPAEKMVDHKLSWPETKDAAAYEYELVKKPEGLSVPDFTTAYKKAGSDTNSADLQLPPGDYFYRVRSVDASGTPGPWSTPASFTVAAASTTPAAGETETGRTAKVNGFDYYSLPSGGKLALKFDVTDIGIGVRQLFASVNDGPFQPVINNRMELRQDGIYTIRWYADDKVGNKSKTQLIRVGIDSTPPTVSSRVENSKVTAQGGVSRDARLVLAAADKGTGLKSIEWRAGQEDSWQEYKGPIGLAALAKEGKGLVQYRATDVLGNTTSLGSLAYLIDITPPQLPAIAAQRGVTRTRNGDKEQLMVSREGFQVPQVEKGTILEYKIDDGEYRRIEPGERIRFEKDGEYTLTMRVTDELGNSQTRTYNIRVDRTAPRSTIKVLTDR